MRNTNVDAMVLEHIQALRKKACTSIRTNRTRTQAKKRKAKRKRSSRARRRNRRAV